MGRGPGRRTRPADIAKTSLSPRTSSPTTAPMFFVYAANDYSVAPGPALTTEMKRLGRAHVLRIFPPVGRTPREGHNLVYLGVATWEPPVFALLDDRLRH